MSAEQRERWKAFSRGLWLKFPDELVPLHTAMGSFDFVSDSLRDSLTALRMTE